MFSALKHFYHQALSDHREAKKRKTRSPKWAHVEKAFLADNPSCAACGSKRHLQVHHVAPFHLHPELELEQSNLLVLCMDEAECHLEIGHGGYFSAWNPNVLVDAMASFVSMADRGVVRARAKAARLDARAKK